MGFFVQLKDDVVFAYHESSTEVDIPGDNIIQVESDGEKFLNKKYVNGTFIDAPEIKYAILDNNNRVVGIGKTIFASEVKDNIIINDPEVDVQWTWNGDNFVSPLGVVHHDTILVDSVQVTTSSIMPAITVEERAALEPIVTETDPDFPTS